MDDPGSTIGFGGETEFLPPLSRHAGGGGVLDALELPVEVRLGRLIWSLGRVLELRVGDAVPVGPDGDDAVTLYVQGKPYASGDLVVVDGRFAFRVRELCAAGTDGEGWR